MKKKRKKNKYIFVLIIVLVILFYLLNIDNKFSYLKGLSAAIFNVDKKDIKLETNSEINELNKEIDKLKEINNIDHIISDKKEIICIVTKRSTPYWHDYITINKGSKDGVKKGYGVVNNSGFVGVVDIVNKYSSEVKLITNTNNDYISAKFNYKDKDYYGIIKKYNVINNELYLENVIGDLDKNIINLNVVTSGLSSNVPSGLLIGKIIDIKKDKYNLSNKITIKLYTDINDLNIVRVVGKYD